MNFFRNLSATTIVFSTIAMILLLIALLIFFSVGATPGGHGHSHNI